MKQLAQQLARHHMSWWRVGIMLMSLFSTVPAQYRLESWTTEHGLPQNSVTAIKQTRDGYLWITTMDGIVRFDGVRFTVFDRSNTPAITSNRFTSLYEDAEGTLWAGTEYGGLIRYRNGDFTALTTAQGLPSNIIEEIQGNPAGGVFIRFENGYGLLREGKFTPAPDPLNNAQANSFTTPNGVRWQKVSDDILRAVTTKYMGRPKRYKRDNPAFYGDLIGRGELLLADRDGNLWGSAVPGQIFSVNDGTIKYYGAAEGLIPQRFTSTEVLPETLLMAAEDHDGTLWFGTGAGLLCFRDGHFTRYTTKDGLAGRIVEHITVDREGVVWVGTESGLTRITKQTITALSTEQGLPNKVIHPILQGRNGDMWIGSYVLTHYAQGKITNIALGPPGDLPRIHALYEDPQGVLWIGGKWKTWRLQNGRVEIFGNELFHAANPNAKLPTCYAIRQDRAHNLWFGTDQGLFRFTAGKMTAYTTANGLPGDEIRILYEDRAGSLWVGATTGLAKWEAGKWVTFPGQEHFQHERVRALHEDNEGTLWVGTYDNGLRRLKQGRVTSYKTENGLFNNEVFQILEDAHDNFWISSNKGIYRVNRAQLNDFAEGKIVLISSVAYGVRDGMRNIECNAGRTPAGTKTRDGKLWFPTQDGVAIVDPEAIPINTLPPPIVLEQIRVNHQTMRVPTTLELRPGQENLEIAYTGLSFIKPDQVKFQYKLEGWDKDWVEAGTRRLAYYSYLSPGTYQFKVKAVNSDGVWSTTTAELQIKVIPPFYRTWWFYTLLALTVGGLVYLVYWYRIRQLRHIHATREAFSQQLLAIQESFAQQLIQSQEKERQRIAAELHDGLGQNLLVIKNRALLGAAAAGEDAAKTHFSEIDLMVGATLSEVRSISHHLRPPHLTRLGLTSTLEEMMEQVAVSADLQIETNITALDGLFSHEAELNIFRICQECLNNVIKHADAQRVECTIARNPDSIRITVRDNGRGCDPAAINNASPRGSGWLSIYERVRILRGSYEIHSALGEGTTIDIQIPLATNQH